MNKLYFIILVFFISSCTIFKLTNESKVDKAISVIDSVYFNMSKFKTVSYRFVAKYADSESNMTVFGSTKLIRDSVLYMKFSPGLGITIAELYTTPDTFMIFFPMKNQYLSGNSEMLLNIYGIPLNFTSLQNIFTAQFFPYPYFIDIDEYEIISDTSYNFTNIVFNKSVPEKPDVFHNFDINSDFYIDGFVINDYVLNKDLVCDYGKYYLYDGIYFPGSSFFTLSGIDTLSLDFYTKKVEFNKEIEIIFNIPDDAKVISN